MTNEHIAQYASQADAEARAEHLTTVEHISNRKPGDIYIGRAGHGEDGYFGNPYRLNSEAERVAVLERYRTYFLLRITQDRSFRDRIRALKGKRLVCFCSPRPCHGDVIASFLNNE